MRSVATRRSFPPLDCVCWVHADLCGRPRWSAGGVCWAVRNTGAHDDSSCFLTFPCQSGCLRCLFCSKSTSHARGAWLRVLAILTFRWWWRGNLEVPRARCFVSRVPCPLAGCRRHRCDGGTFVVCVVSRAVFLAHMFVKVVGQ